MGGSVVVIGGGAAGALAALAARRAGAAVALVRRSPGASALSSGAFDFAQGRGSDGQPLAVAEAARQLAQSRPAHPYARLGERLAAALHRARALVVEELAALGLTGAPSEAENLVLATPLGSVKAAALAQEAIARGDLGRLGAEARLLVVGVQDHAAFDPQLVAAGLQRLGRAAEALRVALPLSPAATMAELAQALDRPEERALFAQRVAEAAAARQAALVLVPTAGYVAPAGLLDLIVAAGASAAAELVGVPPSVPGLRLDRALEARLQAAGVERIDGAVQGATTEAGRVRRIGLDDGRELAAQAFVLATGRFIGGGIRHEERFRETVFGLPVAVDGDDVGDRWLGELLERDPGREQAALRAGLRVDGQMRPVDSAGRVPLGNVFAAGGVVGGYDPAKDWSGLGVAAVTALVAGEAAAALASELAGSAANGAEARMER